MNKIKVARE